MQRRTPLCGTPKSPTQITATFAKSISNCTRAGIKEAALSGEAGRAPILPHVLLKCYLLLDLHNPCTWQFLLRLSSGQQQVAAAQASTEVFLWKLDPCSYSTAIALVRLAVMCFRGNRSSSSQLITQRPERYSCSRQLPPSLPVFFLLLLLSFVTWLSSPRSSRRLFCYVITDNFCIAVLVCILVPGTPNIESVVGLSQSAVRVSWRSPAVLTGLFTHFLINYTASKSVFKEGSPVSCQVDAFILGCSF